MSEKQKPETKPKEIKEEKEVKVWYKDLFDKGKEFGANLLHVAAENTDKIVPACLGTYFFISGFIKIASGQSKKEELFVVDDVTGEKLLTTRKLCNGDVLTLTEEMKDGKSKGEALRDMGLLQDEKRRK